MKLKNKTILIFIDWFSPGYKAGGPVRSNVNLIDHLHSEFNFKVVTRNTEYLEHAPYEGIEANNWIQQQNFEGFYISKDFLSVSTIRNIIKNTPFDIAYVNGIYSPYFSLLPLFFLKVYHKKLIVSARGMLSPHALEVKSFKKKLFLSLAKGLGLYRNVTFHATNEQERDYIKEVFGTKTKILVAPNLPKVDSLKRNLLEKKTNELSLVFIGRISPEKNTLYALEILQAISSKSNINIRFSIYGSIYSEEYWNACKEIMVKLPENIKVQYYGPIEPEKISEVISQHHFLFQPSKGENYGHSMVESFINGCPVIISQNTPWRNLQNTENKEQRAKNKEQENNQYSIINSQSSVGWDLPLEKPEEFLKVIEYCASMDQEEYTAMSQRAFEFGQRITNNVEVTEANKRLFE